MLVAAFISKIKIDESEVICQLKTIRYLLNHPVWNYKDVKYDFLSLFSNKRRVNFLISAAFEHLGMRRLLGGGV